MNHSTALTGAVRQMCCARFTSAAPTATALHLSKPQASDFTFPMPQEFLEFGSGDLVAGWRFGIAFDRSQSQPADLAIKRCTG